MKQLFHTALLLLATLLPMIAAAHDIEVDGIFYNINGNEATVTYRGSYDSEYVEEYSGTVAIPASITHDGTTYAVTAIGYGAFFYCHDLTRVEIPNSITSIASQIFKLCNSLKGITVASDNPYFDSRDNCNAIIETSSNILMAGCQTTVIPATIIAIGEAAFSGCMGLTSMNIPNSVKTIGESAFAECWELEDIGIPNSVTFIGSRAFSCCRIEHIEIPNSVTYIGDYAFFNSSLEHISLPNSITAIEECTFMGCSGLVSIGIPNSVTSIGDLAFGDCYVLTDVVIPNSVTAIGNEAFTSTAWYENQPDGLIYAGLVLYKYKGEMPDGTDVVLRAGTLGIADGAFDSCTGMTSIKLPHSLTNIGSNAFYRCIGLTALAIPSAVTAIGDGAFNSCSGLTCIAIPGAVTSIGEYAFCRCTGLTDVFCYATIPPVCKDNVFSSYEATLHVPDASLDGYHTASCWKNFANIIGDAVEIVNGDVDMDGEIRINDVTKIINYLLTGDATNINVENADFDGNGKVNIADVTTLIRHLLTLARYKDSNIKQL